MDRTELLNILRDELNFKVKEGDYGGENTRYVTLYLGKDEITNFSFGVKDQPEYNG